MDRVVIAGDEHVAALVRGRDKRAPENVADLPCIGEAAQRRLWMREAERPREGPQMQVADSLARRERQHDIARRRRFRRAAPRL